MLAIARTASAAQEVHCFCPCGSIANHLNCWKVRLYWFHRSPVTGENERTRCVRLAKFACGLSQSIGQSLRFSGQARYNWPKTSHPLPTSSFAALSRGLFSRKVSHAMKHHPIPLSLFACGVRLEAHHLRVAKPDPSIERTSCDWLRRPQASFGACWPRRRNRRWATTIAAPDAVVRSAVHWSELLQPRFGRFDGRVLRIFLGAEQRSIRCSEYQHAVGHDSLRSRPACGRLRCLRR